ncbi:MAG: potassium transporter [Chloroflexaceae bacterium]|nr:potassium transporter [Chloroflexaceae bacterium]
MRFVFPGRSRRVRLHLDRPSPHRYHRVAPALRIVGGLGLMILLGTLLLLLPGVGASRPLTPIEALFTATSALSVTGLSIITPGRDLTLAGQIILLVLIQVGGIGFMVIAVVTFRLLGRRVALVDRIALRDSLGLIMPGAILKLTQGVLVTVVTLEGIGAGLFWLLWRENLGDRRALLFAIFHAVSAFCNAGFDLFGAVPDQYPGGIPNDSLSLLVMGSLIFLGGLGIPVIANLMTWYEERRFSLHTRMTLVVVVALVCAGGIGIFLAESRTGRVLVGEPWYRQILLGFFQSVSARTAGFAGIQPFGDISPASQVLLIILMFIGAAPASMGGGITTGTFAVLMVSIWAYARGLPSVQVSGRTIGDVMIRKAAAVLTISLFLVLLATWLLLITHNVGLNVALFEVVSAFATCGLTLDFTGRMNLFGEFIIILMMFWGRLGALTIIVAIAQQQPIRLVEYPEEQILIG